MPNDSSIMSYNDSPDAVRGGAETRDQDDQETFWFFFLLFFSLEFFHFSSYYDSLDLIFKK